MPGLLPRSAQSGSGLWSKQRDDITFDQLQKFWSDLPLQERQELLKIDKQAFFEQARKNLYCSRCNGLLLEGFSQIVMYGKSLQGEGAGRFSSPYATGGLKAQGESELDGMQDASVHPWGGLATTKDGMLTLLDCFMYAESLNALQNVFHIARARERERELLYPDACGGGGRGWMSHGMTNFGRGYGMRETCPLHTTRLSCDTLVDFWLALGEETRSSLLRMKEDDFVERLMYRDCRRNVIREFKELKELKRMRKEPRCSSWFCVPDTAFQYEVSGNTVRADWDQSFTDTVGTYHHFEWAIGSAEGKSDILDFKDVGMNGKVEVNGLDLDGLDACFITLRAWKLDGRCTELCVKAYALKGKTCLHRRLIVGDGFVAITKGESIRRFFEHAEEADEEEDNDATDQDGDEFDSDCSRPQKHAKSPELAREFLLDAATVIFKEQVEKAFREGTARQNAHNIFVCLALKLLEERIHVACKEITTLEKQVKLLEEEEREKREEEQRKERRKIKEKEKKLRRKERQKGKERERELKHIELGTLNFGFPTSTTRTRDSIREPVDISLQASDEQSLETHIDAKNMKSIDEELDYRDGNGSFVLEQSKSSRRKLRFKKSYTQNDELIDRPLREIAIGNARNCDFKFEDRFRRNRSSTAAAPTRDVIHTKQVWEPTDSWKKTSRSNFEPRITQKMDSKPLNDCDLVTTVSSSDNCSSCPSEGDSSSSTQNTDSFPTSDSESVTNAQVPILPSPAINHHNPSTASDGLLPNPYENKYLDSPLSGFGNQCSSPTTPSLTKQIKSSNASKPLRPAIAKQNDEVSTFSLFHFGGPVAAKGGGFLSALPATHIGVSKDEATAEEYSLFAGGSRFTFSFFESVSWKQVLSS